MPYPIERKFVIAVASSALFDLTESERIFREQGLEAYRTYQRQHEEEIFKPGVAFPLVRRLLSLNDGVTVEEAPVEVVLLSKNDPDSGLRVFNSIEALKLPISRAAFVNGGNPFRYMRSFNATLFLSGNVNDVRRAVQRGLPAGRVFPTKFADQKDDMELRVAFDFDGVVVDDSAEAVFKHGGLAKFHESEIQLARKPLAQGPLGRFFEEVARLQKFERARQKSDRSYSPRLRTAIVTSRNAPAHKRVVITLREWDIEVDEVLFLGGIDKSRVLKEFRPHIFFDDQLQHIEGVAGVTPSAHVPFGISNEPSPEAVEEAYAEYHRRKQVPDNNASS
jgi:5'-nucleotidase